ncbi:MAG TPA: aldose epimerase family protein [Trebonia sp.]|nr:aldose epimerase family protein [Trebonia sp.]
MAALAVGGVLAAAKAPAAPTVTKWGGGHLSISKEFFGSTVDPSTNQLTPTFRYTMTNGRGMKIQLLSYGATTQAIWVPGRHGHVKDVVLGFATLADYVKFDSPPVAPTTGVYFGQTIGRYGNRIAKGTFQLKQPDGKMHTYTLQINNGPNSLHGGVVGFGNHIWSQVGGLIHTNDEVGVTLQLISPNGDGGGAAGSPGCVSACTGYPAQITVDVTFTLNNQGQYGIHYNVVNDSPNLNTITNLTNHSYFNLAGEASGSAADQPIFINADNYTPTDATSIPFGTITPVAGTPFDFTHAKPIFPSISDCTQPSSQACTQLIQAEGFDHNWVLNTSGPKLNGLNLAATAFDPGSGRKMSVWTDQPGVQFYTSNFLTGTLIGISGHTYRQTQAYTFETQHFPNSPNQPNFPSTELLAGQSLTTTTIYAFSS